jgi:D-aminopeptidase
VLGTPIPAPQAIGTPGGNSCMIVVATDLPLDARQLGRVARRAVFAMGRAGSDYAPGSGDYAIAFTTATAVDPTAVQPTPHLKPADLPASLPESVLGDVFQATMEATEEALLNSLTMATSVTGFRGNTRYAVPLDLVAAAARLTNRGALADGAEGVR